MHARSLVAIGLIAALAAAPPAAAQNDPLGLGREFGVYVDPSKADAMIRECDAQVREVEASAAAFLAVMRNYVAQENEYWGRIDEVNAAGAAVAEAEARLGQLSGAEADRFAQEIIAPRRERFRTLNTVLPMYTSSRDSIVRQTLRVMDTTMARLRAAGVPESDFAAPPADLSRRAAERCRRMRAWAQLGVQARARSQPPASPAPSGSGEWSERAIAAWRGQWSCTWSSTAQGRTFTVTTPTRITATYHDGGFVQVYLSTGASRWPSSAHPSRVFSPLEVRQARPLHGDFANRDELGEGRVQVDAIDTADVTSDGRIAFERRYGMDPSRTERLDCIRTGPLERRE